MPDDPSFELPAELKGKTPEEIGAYYSNALKVQRDTYETALQAFDDQSSRGSEKPVEKPAEKPIKVGDFLADPEKHTKELINRASVSREEFLAAAKGVQSTMIYVAEERSRKKIQSDVERAGGSFQWDRFASQIKAVVDKCDPYSQTQVPTYEAAYYFVIGSNQHTLTREAVDRATLPMEPVLAGGNEPVKDKVLSHEEKTVANGMGLKDESYNKARNWKDRPFPMTFDNRNKR